MTRYSVSLTTNTATYITTIDHINDDLDELMDLAIARIKDEDGFDLSNRRLDVDVQEVQEKTMPFVLIAIGLTYYLNFTIKAWLIMGDVDRYAELNSYTQTAMVGLWLMLGGGVWLLRRYRRN